MLFETNRSLTVTVFGSHTVSGHRARKFESWDHSQFLGTQNGSLTVSVQSNVKYSIKIVSISSPLDYVIASSSSIENVKSRLVPTSLDDSFQKHLKRENVGQKTRLDFSRKRRAKNETRFFVFVETPSKTRKGIGSLTV